MPKKAAEVTAVLPASGDTAAVAVNGKVALNVSTSAYFEIPELTYIQPQAAAALSRSLHDRWWLAVASPSSEIGPHALS
jgi:hypothetical protein